MGLIVLPVDHAWWFYAHSIVRGGVDKVHVGLEIKPAG
jgi:uncharacterized protein